MLREPKLLLGFNSNFQNFDNFQVLRREPTVQIACGIKPLLLSVG